MVSVLPLRLRVVGSGPDPVFSAVINVKEPPYYAQGDGVADDGPAIQAALDAAYGVSPGYNAHNYQNRSVYVPAGTYHIGQQLNWSTGTDSGGGGLLFGDGQRATRLVYTGPSAPGTYGVTSLLIMHFVNYAAVQGIGFDVTGSNALCCINMAGYPSSGGTGVTWFDVGIKGATSYGMKFDAAALGSEQTFVNCTFDGCSGTTSPVGDRFGTPVGAGVLINSPNAIDHTYINCRFTNNDAGIFAEQGGPHLVQGCNFHNNNRIDIHVKQSFPISIAGCWSDSPNFFLAGPAWVSGCYHDPSSTGVFFKNDGVYFDQDLFFVLVEGCYVGNSRLVGTGYTLYERGNKFIRGDALTSWTGTLFSGQ